jgi:hypothetical protein
MSLDIKPNIDISASDITKTIVNAPERRFAGSVAFVWGCLLLIGFIVFGHALLTRPDLPEVVRGDRPEVAAAGPTPSISPSDVPSPASPSLLIQESWTVILDPKARLTGFYGSLGATDPDELRASLPEGCSVAINGNRAMAGVCSHGTGLTAGHANPTAASGGASDENL